MIISNEVKLSRIFNIKRRGSTLVYPFSDGF
jgi:hypothetical protein